MASSYTNPVSVPTPGSFAAVQLLVTGSFNLNASVPLQIVDTATSGFCVVTRIILAYPSGTQPIGLTFSVGTNYPLANNMVNSYAVSTWNADDYNVMVMNIPSASVISPVYLGWSPIPLTTSQLSFIVEGYKL